MTSSMRVIMQGADGRMGRSIAEVCAGESVPFLPLDASTIVPTRSDVVVDFSSPHGALLALRFACDHQLPFVCGTTGVDDAFHTALTNAAARIPAIHAPNMSLGVAVLRFLTRRAVQSLGDTFDIEILDIHHRRKRDAPSGTALALTRAVHEARDFVSPIQNGRDGLVGERPDNELGVHAMRGGDVVGEHTVFLLGDGERLELTHRASTRAVFAHGTLRVGRWIVGKPPGLYTIDDVLGLSEVAGR